MVSGDDGSYDGVMFSVALTLFVTLSPPTTPPPPATMTPVSDQDFQAKVLQPRRGHVVVVNFWASYCVPCLQEIPALQALAKQYAGVVDVVFVSSDPLQQADHALALLKRRKVDLTSFVVSNEDPDPFIRMIDKNWQGEMPFTVVYDDQGRPIQSLLGGHTQSDLQAAIDAALAAQKTKKAAQP